MFEQVGSSVGGFAPGQSVLPLAFGTWAEQMLVLTEALVPLPESKGSSKGSGINS